MGKNFRYCAGGEVFDALGMRKTLTEYDIATIMKQLLSAVAYCHSKSVVHRDIKPENLLFDTQGKDATLKVIDFGMSQIFNPGLKMSVKIGTPLYIAPEVLSKSYTEKCDLWSCGVILYVLLSGTHPFTGSSEEELFRKIRRGKFSMSAPCWEFISRDAIDLIKKMITVDPNRRCSALEALKHPWIQGTCKDKVYSTKVKALLNGLRTFTTQYKLQQAVLQYIVTQLISDKEKKQFQTIFVSLDKDNDGKLGREELIEGYKEIFGEGYPAEEKVDEIIKQIDSSNSGYIELTEFIVATMNKRNLLSMNRLVAAFNMFDKDGSGGITAEEVKEVLGVGENISIENWEEVIKEVDLNGDGEISLNEFITMMYKLLEN